MDARIRSRALFLTILLHAALILALLFVVMTTPNPPFPEMGGGGGVLVNIGYVDESTGDVQPMSEQVTTTPSEAQVTPTPQSEDDFATQETEEAPIAKENKEAKKNPNPPKTTPQPITTPQKQTQTPRKVDPGSLYSGKTTASRSQGTGASGSGDQGDPKGDPNSMYTGKGGAGGGVGSGNGTGNGDGEGPGFGSGKGGGVSFSLVGRKWNKPPPLPRDNTQKTGKVVVNITVDNKGNVTSAIPGGRGSTTTDSYLFSLAKEAAMKAKFDENPDAGDIQRGTITFVFVVQ